MFLFAIAGWAFVAITAVGLNAWNIQWDITPTWQGVCIVLVIGILQGSMLEMAAMTITTLILRGKVREHD